MLGDIAAAEQIYIACGYTDMRKSIGSPFLKSYAAVCLVGAIKMSDRVVKEMMGLQMKHAEIISVNRYNM